MSDMNHIQVVLSKKDNLKKALSDIDVSTIKRLTIKGKISKSCFSFINKKMRSTLEELDISGEIIDDKDSEWIYMLGPSELSALRIICIGASIKKIAHINRITQYELLSYGAEVHTVSETFALFDAPALEVINVHPDNPIYFSKDGVLFKKEEISVFAKINRVVSGRKKQKTILMKFPPKKSGDYTIPDNTEIIAKHAFAGCKFLSSIAIPNSVKSIGIHAFSGCSKLEKVELPDCITQIPEGMFINCSSLKYINIPNSITNIGNSAFKGCSRLENIILPDSITKINYSTFEDCVSLSQIDIPESIIEIDHNAFKNCTAFITVDSHNPKYKSVDGKIYEKQTQNCR